MGGGLVKRGTRRFVIPVEVVVDLDEYDAEYGTHETVAEIRAYIEGNVHSASTESFRHLPTVRVRIKERNS